MGGVPTCEGNYNYTILLAQCCMCAMRGTYTPMETSLTLAVRREGGWEEDPPVKVTCVKDKSIISVNVILR